MPNAFVSDTTVFWWQTVTWPSSCLQESGWSFWILKFFEAIFCLAAACWMEHFFKYLYNPKRTQSIVISCKITRKSWLRCFVFRRSFLSIFRNERPRGRVDKTNLNTTICTLYNECKKHCVRISATQVFFVLHVLFRFSHYLKLLPIPQSTRKLQLGGQFNLIYVEQLATPFHHNISSYSIFHIFFSTVAFRRFCSPHFIWFVCYRCTMNFCFIKFCANHCFSFFVSESTRRTCNSLQDFLLSRSCLLCATNLFTLVNQGWK